MPYPEAEAKNLFLRDDKKRNWYLVTVKGHKKLDLRRFQAEHGTRRLSFASDHDLMKYLKLIPGAVTPFGLLNDETCTVQFFWIVTLNISGLEYIPMTILHPYG